MMSEKQCLHIKLLNKNLSIGAKLDIRLDILEIKQGLDFCEQRKRK